MIFGEDFGQLASCGEYEVYKSGTTLAQLNAAIASLSDEEYLDSFLVVNTDMTSSNFIHRPMNNRSDNNKIYMATLGTGNDNVLYTQFWQGGTLYYRVKTIANGSMTVVTKSTSGSGSTLLTITSWTLYRRQKGYDVAGSGGNAASLIAPVQTSLSAAKKAYAVGEQFVYDNKLYKVTASITSGAQIVIGTNAVAADDITTQIRYTDWTNCKASGITGTVKYKKSGDIVMLSVHVTGLTQNTYTTVGTLPQGVRPSGDTYFCSRTVYNSANNATVYIGAAGTIQVYPISDTNAYGDFTFIM